MSTSKRFAIGINVIFQVLILLLMFALVNFVGFRRFTRWDFSRDQKYALSPQTKNLLGSLPKPVKAIIYFSGAGIGRAITTDIDALLKEYNYASGRKFTVETVNPYVNLSRARELAEKYKFAQEENIVILDYDGKSKFVNATDMVELEQTQMNPFMQAPPEIKAFKGEAAITTALLELVEGKQQKLYATTGHGEPDLRSEGEPNPNTVTSFAERLKRSNIKYESLNLLDAERIPEDTTVLMIFGPRQDFSEREIQMIDDYWNNKGHLLLLLHGSAKTPRLNAWLAANGLKPLGAPIVAQVQTINIVTGQRSAQTVLDGQGKFSGTATAVLRELAGTNAMFFGPTTGLEIDRSKSEVQVTSLAESAKQFWVELDSMAGPAVPSRDPAREKEGPFTLAASVEKGAVPGLKLNSSRMVVVANSGFLTDGGAQTVDTGLDFGLNSINWLLSREQGVGVGIPPKEKKLTTLTMDEWQLNKLAFSAVLGLPALVFAFGIVSWLQRRR